MGHLGSFVVERPTLAQVMILQFVGLSPPFRLCADSSEPGACLGFCVSLSLSLPLPYSCSCSLSLKNKLKKIKIKK